MVNFLEVTRSRLRKRLLSYFFTNPDASLYVRELACLLKEDPGNLSKELNRLEREGIFASNLRGNQRYFSINKEHPLYNELKSMIFKTIGVEGSLRKIINETMGITASFIYGSFARDRENTASDIDLFIIGNPDEDGLIGKIETLEKNIHREINYNIYSEKEFKNRITKKDSFMLNIIKRPKIVLKGTLDGI